MSGFTFTDGAPVPGDRLADQAQEAAQALVAEAERLHRDRDIAGLALAAAAFQVGAQIMLDLTQGDMAAARELAREQIDIGVDWPRADTRGGVA